MEQRKITVIPATLDPKTRRPVNLKKKRRVAGYARVSTDSEEQKISYEAQVEYYTSYINSRDDWEFVKVYTDEGISGTTTKNRIGFNQMIQDALNGEIDLIITKSISRFARNTVDTLTRVRELKDNGVEVFFEKENIYTLDSKNEILITIMSSLAQEESRSISENVRWGKQKRFADGKVELPYSHFLGYEKGKIDGIPEINEEQAVIVRRIFHSFLYGTPAATIARELTEEGIPTPAGKAKWRTATVLSILQNEKYKGSAILQKEFTVDFLTKKRKKNEGEVPQYYIENSHEAIVDPRIFEDVQREIERRKALGNQYSGKNVFSSKVVCGDCGKFFGPKVWHSNSKYKKTIWRCNDKFNGEERCETPHVNEEILKSAFVKAFNSLIDDRKTILEDYKEIQAVLTDCTELESEVEELQDELEVIEGLMKRLIKENATVAQDQEEYEQKYSKLEKRHDKACKKINSNRAEILRRQKLFDDIGGFMFELMENEEPVTEFDEKVWYSTIEKVIVHKDGKLQYCFKGGAEVTV